MYPKEDAWLWTIRPQIFTCVSWDTCVHKLQPCWSGGLYRSRVCPSLKSQHMILWKTILSKYQYYCHSDFENSKGMPKRGLHTIQQFPDRTRYRDSHIHLISARISTPTSFPMVCGLENTNVHVSWSWAAKEKSPPKRQSCMLLVALKLFTIVQHNVTLTTISHREIVFFSTFDVI